MGHGEAVVAAQTEGSLIFYWPHLFRLLDMRLSVSIPLNCASLTIG